MLDIGHDNRKFARQEEDFAVRTAVTTLECFAQRSLAAPSECRIGNVVQRVISPNRGDSMELPTVAVYRSFHPRTRHNVGCCVETRMNGISRRRGIDALVLLRFCRIWTESNS